MAGGAETSGTGWALVDVETSGMSARRDRILSIAVMTLDESGRVEEEYATLLNPGCDPGPVHIHRLTRERLRDAPTFDATIPHLQRMLSGRTLVAHNATFDHGFLVEEARRLEVSLPVTHRLCTVTLARRLQLDVPNVKLGTLARYWGIPRTDAHDARDDVRTLAAVFRRILQLARSLGLGLSAVACGDSSRAHPSKAASAQCPWRNPGRYDPNIGLVQGTKVAITGPTAVRRTELARRFVDAGLDVTSGVSRRTGLVVANPGVDFSRKLQRASEFGIPVLDEQAVLQLLGRVVEGALKAAPKPVAAGTANRPEKSTVVTPPARPSGPWSGRRVLVLGGNHVEATMMRSRIVQLGAVPAINLTATVTDVLVLDGGDGDPRMPTITERQLTILEMRHVDTALGVDVEELPVEPEPVSKQPEWTPTPMSPGAVIDLPADLTRFAVNVAWGAEDDSTPVVDLVAFELDIDEKVLTDDEFVFYNQPATPDGAVALTIDGDREQGVSIDLSAVPADVARITIGATIEERTFGDIGALSISIDTTERTIAAAVLDGATTERSMIIGEIYRRRGVWRLRVVGQGYDDDLAAFAIRHGVDVDD